MKLSEKEFIVIWKAVNHTGELNRDGIPLQRNVPMAKLPIASKIIEAMQVHFGEDGRIKDQDLYEVEYDTSGKAFILECMNRDWPANMSVDVLSAKAKLEK